MSSVYTGDDVYRPSYFELIAQDRLLPGLKPALKHLFTVLSTRRATYTNTSVTQYWLTKYYDEIFYSLLFILENYYLNEYNGTFAENFYGLKRVQINLVNQLSAQSTDSNATNSSSTNDSSRYSQMKSSDRTRTLLFTVLLPYVRSRIDGYYHILTTEYNELGEQNQHYIGLHNNNNSTSNDNSADNTFTFRLKKLFLRLYPYIHALVESINFIFNLRYLFEQTQFYDLSQYILNQCIRRLSMDDMIQLNKRASERDAADAAEIQFRQIWNERNTMSLITFCKSILIRVLKNIADYAKWSLLLSIFVFKFLEWWYSPQNKANQSVKLPVPPAPLSIPPHTNSGVQLPADKSMCSLCNNQRVNPACIPSGYVFCYTCVHSYVNTHQQCPVTLMSCNVDMIRRIYDDAT